MTRSLEACLAGVKVEAERRCSGENSWQKLRALEFAQEVRMIRGDCPLENFLQFEENLRAVVDLKRDDLCDLMRTLNVAIPSPDPVETIEQQSSEAKGALKMQCEETLTIIDADGEINLTVTVTATSFHSSLDSNCTRLGIRPTFGPGAVQALLNLLQGTLKVSEPAIEMAKRIAKLNKPPESADLGASEPVATK